MRIGYRTRTTAGDKTIRLPLPEGIDYDTWLEDGPGYRRYLDEQISKYPAVTAAVGCFLDVGLSETSDKAGLMAAYGEFKLEALMCRTSP
jgi:hypothetical protein